LNVAAGIALLLVLGACGAPEHPEPTTGSVVRHSQPLSFVYRLVDGNGVVSARALRGQPVLISFLATYDLASQAQARFLSGVFQRHSESMHAAAIVLERSDNQPLVLAFRDTLKLTYPVAMGDEVLIGGGGPFGDVHAVPSTVLLDREGRIVWKHIGLAREEDLEQALAGAS